MVTYSQRGQMIKIVTYEVTTKREMERPELLSLRLEGKTYGEIAKQAGISRQRVQQLLSPPRKIRDSVVLKYSGCCKDCGLYVGKKGHIHHNNSDGEDFNDVDNLELLCISCHRRRHKVITHSCIVCKKPLGKSARQETCSRECHRKLHETMAVCSNCGIEFPIELSVLNKRMKQNKKSDNLYCSRKCYRQSRIRLDD